MAGTATNFDITRLQQGPGNLWVIGGGVPDSATPQLTIASDGTPDATAHPSSIHLGGWTSGQAIQVASKPKMEDLALDQFDGPVAQIKISQEITMSVELAQLDPAIMQNAVPYGTYSTSSGYRQLTFGDEASPLLTGLCVATIVQKRSVAGKYVVFIMFSAVGVMGLDLSMGRAKMSGYKTQWKGLVDPTRTAGRRTAVLYDTN